MPLFDFIKGKNRPESPAREELEQATAHYQAGRYEDAINTVVQGFRKDVDNKGLYELAAQCLARLGAEEPSAIFEDAARGFGSFESYYMVGKHFFESGYYGVAIPFLEKAHAMQPEDAEVAHDLALSLARRFQIGRALEVLEATGPRADFWNYFFWSKLRVLTGQPEGVAGAAEEMTESLDSQEVQDGIEIPRLKVREVQEMLDRYEQLPEPRQHIQDWHFIQYGAAILDFFDSPEYVAGGRYVAAWGTLQSVKEVLVKLKMLLDKLAVKPAQIRYLPDRDAEIIALTAAKLLELPAHRYEPEPPAENALIIAANSTDFDDCPELAEILDGQILFAFNHNWLTSAYLTPDIVGLMSQMYSFPWNGGGIRVVDAEKGITERMAADERPAAEIAEDIAREEGSEVEEAPLEFYVYHKEYLKGIGVKGGTERYNFMIETPVAGAFFE